MDPEDEKQTTEKTITWMVGFIRQIGLLSTLKRIHTLFLFFKEFLCKYVTAVDVLSLIAHRILIPAAESEYISPSAPASASHPQAALSNRLAAPWNPVHNETPDSK